MILAEIVFQAHAWLWPVVVLSLIGAAVLVWAYLYAASTSWLRTVCQKA